MDDVVKFKDESTEIMKDAGFELHKWHSNCPDVESTNNQKECETTYAETLAGNPSIGETKLLGLPWDKKIDVMAINFASCIEVKKPITKRKVIVAINSVSDILGWSSPVIIGKIIFAEIFFVKETLGRAVTKRNCREMASLDKSFTAAEQHLSTS